MRRSHSCPAAVSVAVAVLLSSCGGGSSDNAFTGPQLTRAAYVSKANRICRDAARKSPPFPGKKSGSGFVTSARTVIPYLHTVVQVNTKSLRRLKALNPPAAMRSDAEHLVEAQKNRLFDLGQALSS